MAEGVIIGAIISAVASAGTAAYQSKQQEKLQNQAQADAEAERKKIKATGQEAESGGIKQLKDAEAAEESARKTARKGTAAFRIPLESAAAVGTQTGGATGLKI